MFYEPLKFRRQFDVERLKNCTTADCNGFELLAHLAATDDGIDENIVQLKRILLEDYLTDKRKASSIRASYLKIESADPRQQSDAELEAGLNGGDAVNRHCCYSELNSSSV